MKELSLKLSPFKYLEGAVGGIVVKSEDNIDEIHNELQGYIKEVKDNTIILKNGSVINIIKVNNGDVVRGRRSRQPIFFDDFKYCKEDIGNVLDKYATK